MSDMKPVSYTVEAYESMRRAYIEKCFELARVKERLDHLTSNGVTVQKWIPVSERLPENDSHVLVARKNGDVDTDMHIYTWWKVGPVERNITHWMPLPEPPKECE